MIESLLVKYLDVSKSDEQYRHLSLVLISIFACTGAAAAFFAFYNLVIDYYPPLLLVDAVGTLMGFISLSALHVLSTCFSGFLHIVINGSPVSV